MNKKKVLIIAGAAAVIAMAGFVVAPRLASASSGDVTVSATPVRMGELSNYISVTGTVESANSINVYSEINERVNTVHVKLGDYVTEGQLLCELDTTDIESSISEQRSSMELSSQNSYNQIKESERAYSDALANLKNSTNSQLNSAQNSLKNAESDLASKQRIHSEKLAEYNAKSATKLINAERSIATAEDELAEKKKAYEDNLELYAIDAVSKADLDASERALRTAEDSYSEAVKSLEDVKKELSDELESAKEALDNAQAAYDNAQLSLKTANTSVQQELVKYQESIESAKLAANNDSQVFALQRLERELEQTQITAPASGTITAVYAKAGVEASGLLFVIEDTGNLKVTTGIKEYDLPKMSVGLPATIESDATGDEIFDGELVLIAPTSQKDSTGATIASTDVDFAAEVAVVSGTGLRIGSNARVDLIYERKDGVLYVPVEAVAEGMGEAYVYVLQDSSSKASGGERPSAPASNASETSSPGGAAARAEGRQNAAFDADATYTVKRVPVTTGIETDLYIEITGELRPGMMIANNPALVSEGDEVKIGLSNSGFKATTGTLQPGGMGGGPMMRIGG